MSDHDRCGESPVEALSRRAFLRDTAIGIATMAALPCFASSSQQQDVKVDFPIVDYHVHLSGALTIEKTVELANTRGVKFGIVEHPGPGYKIVDDKALAQYLDMLKKYAVYRGLQPVYPNWSKVLSKELLSQLDYILMDALTLPEKDGGWLRIWRTDTVVPDRQAFMERYLEFNLRVLAEEPLDIFACPTYLPSCISQDYDVLWTNQRMQKLIDIAIKRDVAMEINEPNRVPKPRFISMAKDAGIRFTFGTNSRNDRAGRFEYCLQMAKQCGLSEKNMFKLKPDGQKAIQRAGKA